MFLVVSLKESGLSLGVCWLLCFVQISDRQTAPTLRFQSSSESFNVASLSKGAFIEAHLFDLFVVSLIWYVYLPASHFRWFLAS